MRGIGEEQRWSDDPKNVLKLERKNCFMLKLALMMRSLDRDSNRCSSFCVSMGTVSSSSHRVGPLMRVSWSSRISRQKSLTVFLLFLVASLPLWCNWTPKYVLGGRGKELLPPDGGGIGGGGMLGIIGIGGGNMQPFCIGGGGGGGGPKPLLRTGFSGSLSSSICKSVKSRSQIWSGRSSVSSRLSQCNSFSDFFGSIRFVAAGELSLKFLRSWRDFDLMSSSLAFEMIPLRSPNLMSLSSVGDVGLPDMWFACLIQS